MGHDVFALLGSPLPLFNIQKGRVDYILDVMTDQRLKARPYQVATFMERQDIIPLIAQEADLAWLRLRPPLAVYMDSFSELTDQLFVHRQNQWRFCCNYSDLRHSSEFDIQFEAMGLLPVADLLMYYRRFFSMVRQRWGNIPILFLHFPTTLDKREKFQLRYKHIRESITQVAQEFQPFYSLTVDDSIVDWPEVKTPGLEDFPYHYNQRTYQASADQVRATKVLESFKAKRR
jgi:hypothetical protein